MDFLSPTIKMISALSIVVAGILLTLYLLKLFLPLGKGVWGKEKFINIIASDYLGAKKSILLVEVAGETLVLGVSNESISLLSKVTDKEILARLKQMEKKKNTFSLFKQKENSE